MAISLCVLGNAYTMRAMTWLLLAGHLCGISGAIFVGRSSMQRGLLFAALAPAATTVYASILLINGTRPDVSEFMWVHGLDIGVRFSLDSVALLMTLLVSGIGTLVFVYGAGYFTSSTRGGARFSASLLAFSTSMLGLVWADSIWTLFIFWEFTSITSFLLVGHKNTDPSVIAAARRALLITGGGGLSLLAGLLILADASDTVILSDLPMVHGTQGAVAAMLVMFGAATKSAQVPFHVWLPGAMAAPTPVSAYLHSATMVKAGVLLLAVTGSAFADVAMFKTLGMAFGISSMLWGAIGALRHRDAKLILAWGTVSQLGLLVTLLSLGTGKAVFAATSLLFAHALFKAALFLVVGEIDIRTGTRDIDQLGGLARSMPIAFGVSAIAGLSMAGAPPLLGFTAKEAAIEAVLTLDGSEKTIALVSVVGGAVLTVAYTIRFLISVFGPGPATIVSPRRWAMTIPAVILAAASLLGFVWLGTVNAIVRPAAIELNAASEKYSLLRWPGFTTGLLVSMGVVVLGTAAGWALARVPSVAPHPRGADTADSLIDGTLAISRRVTARVQHGSMPVYITTMAATASLATLPFLTELSTDHLVLWDSPFQAMLVLVIVSASVAGAFVGSRLGAALTLGIVGIGASGLFIVHGAPDLALTQLLVETIVVVGFVIGLGHLARQFPRVTGAWRSTRMAVSILAGIVVALGLAASSANPSGSAPLDALATASVDEGGGNNVVNVILTDLRALDTLGEVVVLATVALGILALANTRDGEAAA